MGPVGRVPPTFEQAGTPVGRSPQLLKIVRQTRAQNALHLVSNAQNCVGFWGSAPDPDGETYLAPQNLLVVRSFLPSAISPICTINASIVQGSGLGHTDENRLLKYADDSYLLVSASCIDSTLSELDHISKWASISNLKLNHAIRPEKWLSNDRGPNLFPSILSSLASSGSRRRLFWVSPSLIGLALGHTWTKYAAKPENPCSRYVFWSPTVTTVNVSLTLLSYYSRTATLCLPCLVGICHCRVIP